MTVHITYSLMFDITILFRLNSSSDEKTKVEHSPYHSDNVEVGREMDLATKVPVSFS